MLFESYKCKTENVVINENEETYEIPDSDGARISKLASPGKLLRCQYDDAKTLIEVMERGCRLSGNGRCVGWRSSKHEYSWINYNEFMSRAINFGSGLENLGIKLGQSCRVCIYAQNSVEWLVTQYGCFYYSSPIVPLYEMIGLNSQVFIINQVEAQVVICDDEHKVKELLDKKELIPSLKYIAYIRNISEETKELGKTKGIKLYLFTDIEKIGKDSPVPINTSKPTDDALICYTSGTTGEAKGAILSHKSIIAAVSGVLTPLGDQIPTKDDVLISYLPLAHTYEQAVHAFVFMHGGSIGFFGGDKNLLIDDMQVLKPTIFSAVPRVLNKIYDMVKLQIKLIKSSLKENGSRKPDKNTKDLINGTERNGNSLISKALSHSLGGNIRFIVSAAAPISEEVLSFFRLALNCMIFEVYGQTECSGPITINIVTKDTIGSIGIPALSNMIKLVDVPELGYFKVNKIGEICVKGLNVFKSYIKDHGRTAETIDEDGWLHTGDIGMWLTNGTLKIVDRKKHIFKLSQGEYVIPEKIESIYLESSYVSQIFIYGNRLKNFLIAIVIPEQTETMAWCNENSISGTWNDICNNRVVKQHILRDLQRIGKTSGLLTFHQAKDIHLHPELLTAENGYLTPTQKMKRYLIQKLFENEIQAMYN